MMRLTTSFFGPTFVQPRATIFRQTCAFRGGYLRGNPWQDKVTNSLNRVQVRHRTSSIDLTSREMKRLLVYDVDGEALLFDSLWEGRNILLVFLREFGCASTTSQIYDLIDYKSSILETGTSIVVIGNGNPGIAVRYIKRYPALFTGYPEPDPSNPIPITKIPIVEMFCDVGQYTYRIFGLKRGRIRTLLNIYIFKLRCRLVSPLPLMEIHGNLVGCF